MASWRTNTPYYIETEDLGKRNGDVTAVDHLSLRVAEDEIYAFLGLNGAGKTTTIRNAASPNATHLSKDAWRSSFYPCCLPLNTYLWRRQARRGAPALGNHTTSSKIHHRVFKSSS
jgi:hypothetical protein